MKKAKNNRHRRIIFDLTLSTKDEHMKTPWPSNPTPKHKLKGNGYMFTKDMIRNSNTNLFITAQN